MTLKQVISLSLLLTFKGTHAFDFLEESPVKLLHIHSVASRYQAADSEFRMAVENGKVSVALLFIHSFIHFVYCN